MRRVALSLALAAAATAAWADAGGGQADYLQLCAACHGTDGRGSADSQTPGADLTALSETNGGDFPYWLVFATIDGRYIPPGHDDRAMPVWGRLFFDEARKHHGPNQSEIDAQERMHALTAYVQTLQR